MYDQLWEESPRIQKMREKMREEIKEQIREENYKKAKAKGFAQGLIKGELKALRHILVITVQARFPDLTELAQKQANLCRNVDVLQLLVNSLIVAPDARIAQWLLESISKQ